MPGDTMFANAVAPTFGPTTRPSKCSTVWAPLKADAPIETAKLGSDAKSERSESGPHGELLAW